MSDKATYCQRNGDKILNRANEILRKKARKKQRELSEEEKI